MKFLLVVYAFILTPNGNIEEAEVFKQVFATESECNYAGRNLREIMEIDGPEYNDVKTLSVCVSQRDDFN